MCEIIDKAMVLFLRCMERESQNMLQILERAAALLTAEQAFAGVSVWHADRKDDPGSGFQLPFMHCEFIFPKFYVV